MSGGVDSSVAAAVLHDQGYDVIGVTMQLWDYGEPQAKKFGSCCSLSDVNDARIVAHMVGVPHYVVNYEKEFRAGVVDYFAEEYAAGRTPNPCVMCNSKLKFDHLMDLATKLGAKWVATGHYARIEHFSDGRPSAISRGIDTKKDQSYFLFNLKNEFIDRILFPLSELTKDEVRAIAEKYQLPTAGKKDSQEICFVAGGTYQDFLSKHYPQMTQLRGELVDTSGNVLGTHDGIHLFTVGQRKGLNIYGPKPRYVAGIDPATNRVTVADIDELAQTRFELNGVSWFEGVKWDDTEGVEGEVVLRYRAKALPARAIPTANPDKWIVELYQPASWVTPGQAAVFYRGDRLLGGGFIASPHESFGKRNDDRTGRTTVSTHLGGAAGASVGH